MDAWSRLERKAPTARRLAKDGWSVGDIAWACDLTPDEVRSILPTTPRPKPVHRDEPDKPTEADKPAEAAGTAPPAAVPSDDYHHLNSHRRRWARWLSLCGLPPAHVAAVLVCDPAIVSAYLAKPIDPRSAYARGLPSVHQGRRVCANKVAAGNAPMIRRLAALGYTPDVIGGIMRVPPADITGFLDRERRKAEPPRPRPVKPAGWARTDSRLDSIGSTPTPPPVPTIAAAELPLDLVVNVAEPTTPATEQPPDDRPAWGCFQYRFARGEAHGRARLTRAMVDEARELRAAGWSTGRLAERFGVARNTIAYALNGSTWRDE